MMDEYRDNQVKKLMMKRRKKEKNKSDKIILCVRNHRICFFYFIV